MARRRKSRLDLPPRVYFKHGAYYYAQRAGKWIRLDIDRARAIARYAKLLQIELPTDTVGDLVRRYLQEIAPLKAPRTYRDNITEARALLTAFGDMLPEGVRPHHIAMYLAERGKKSKVRANREIALLSHVYTKALGWGVALANPCRGVERHREPKRTRYITDEEFDRCRAIAPEHIACMMDFAVMTGIRQGDMLTLTMDAIKSDGIEHTQGKTGKRIRFEWTPELRALIAHAKSLGKTERQQASRYLFPKRDGSPYSENGFRTVWQRVQCLFAEQSGVRFRWHDIRAKCLTDANRQGLDAQTLAGHASRAMTERYIKDREIQTAQPLRRNIRQGPDIGQVAGDESPTTS